MAKPRQNPLNAAMPVWMLQNGDPVSCTEKIRVLNDNYEELTQTLKDMLEDGVLMGCDEAVLRQQLATLVQAVRLDVCADDGGG